MQIRAGLKKEWLQFTRTFRLGGVLLATLSFALAEPLLLWGMQALLSLSANYGAGLELTTLLEMTDIEGMSSAAFSSVMTELSATSMLVIMLVLMSPCGGEQKRRATIIPSCTGLGAFEYLVPKFVVYPATVFASGFAAACLGGLFSNLLFDGSVSAGTLVLGSLMCAVYMTFVLIIYMSVGLCTSRPGIVTAAVYVGIPLVHMILSGLDLTEYHPLTLCSLITGRMFRSGFVLADNVASIIVGIALSVVIAAMMFVLALTVQKARKINNQEDKPEF